MKTRLGFVSNSSSSSFCLYGTYVDNIEEICNKFDIEWSEDECWDSIEKIKEKLSSFCCMIDGECCEYMYLGQEWESIGDDETGGEFKARVEAQLKEVLGENITCSTHTEEISH